MTCEFFGIVHFLTEKCVFVKRKLCKQNIVIFTDQKIQMFERLKIHYLVSEMSLRAHYKYGTSANTPHICYFPM